MDDESTGAAVRPLYLGTYTSIQGGTGTGVTLGGYRPGTGEITTTGVLPVDNPSWLVAAPDGRTLYTVNEQPDGRVTALAVRPDGTARILNSRSTGGDGPTHAVLHPGGRHLVTANYDSGSVAVHPIDPDGSLGERTDLVHHDRPAGPGRRAPHAHQIIAAPDGGHLLAVDLGHDTVYGYRLDPRTGRLTETARSTLPPGTGPRHLAFHPDGRHAYLANELANTVTTCRYDPSDGRLTPGRSRPAGSGAGPNHPAEVLVNRRGDTLYLSNRGWNTVARFAVEEGGAELRLLDETPAGGDQPRGLSLDPAQRLLFAANQASGTVTVFAVGPDGRLTPAGPPCAAPTPVFVLPL